MYVSIWRIAIKIQIFTLKHKTLLFSSLCTSLALWILLSLSTNLPSSDQIQLKSNQDEPLAYTCCTPSNKMSLRTNVYFVKTHKTGSTTVKNVILRFAFRNSLDVMDINIKTYSLPFSDASIHPHAKTPNNKYHIMAQHVRYESALKSYQYPNTSMVTILRHPATQFQSKYEFCAMSKTTGMSLQQFLNAPVQPSVLQSPAGSSAYKGYNQISVDLGFDVSQSKNQTAIAEFIRKIDREFDLVMLMEHMEASMILLANLMGWPLEYVASLRLNSRNSESEPYKLTLRDEITIMNLNQVDTLLYNHFSDKFRKCVRQYGEQKMNERIQQLKIINEKFAHRCIGEEIKKPLWYGGSEMIEYKPKNASDVECVYAVASTFALADILKKYTMSKTGWFDREWNFYNFFIK
ncbi:galactose-3-O-sulfotransferase 3-like [Planococcus citri]|uniref:galactose-3-O-sulfotransferase 3-like n=1 Tax=Planococcus citri TaxID=170843 RepID=UPI0031F8971E